MDKNIIFGSPYEEPLPVEEFPDKSIPIGDVSTGDEFQIFITQEAYQAMQRHVSEDPNTECAGVLVGHPFKTPDGHSKFVIIVAALRNEAHDTSPVYVTVTAESSQQVRRQIEREYPKLTPVGWYHSHPGHSVFLSGDDQQVTQGIYNASWHVAIVIDPQKDETGFFRGPEGEKIPGYFQLQEIPLGLEPESPPLPLPGPDNADTKEMQLQISELQQKIRQLEETSTKTGQIGQSGIKLSFWLSVFIATLFIAVACVVVFVLYSEYTSASIIATGVKNVQSQVDELSQELTTLQPLPQQIVTLQTTLARHEKKISELTPRLQTVEANLANLTKPPPIAVEETTPAVISVPIPDVIGMLPDEAQQVLQNAGFTVDIQEYQDGDVPEKLRPQWNEAEFERIIYTDPAPDTSLEPGQSVTIMIKIAPKVEFVLIPDVTGMSPAEARTKLQNIGLTATIQELQESDVPEALRRQWTDSLPETVISTDPAPGASLESGQTVVVMIKSVPEITPILVPNVIGKPSEEAQQETQQAGLVVTLQEYQQADVPEALRQQWDAAMPGTVLSTNPAPDTPLEPGQSVELVVKKVASQISVPDVVGRPKEEAQIDMQNLGFSTTIQELGEGNVPEELRRQWDEATPGTVIYTEPAPGVQLDAGQSITLTVKAG